MPIKDAGHYYSVRQRETLAKADATADPTVRKIHLEMARLYAKLAGEGHEASIAALDPHARLMPEQPVMSIRAKS